jgi:hypothetical protein
MNRFNSSLLSALQRRSVAVAPVYRLSPMSLYSSMPGSPLGKRESALEERFILDHEREVVAQLRKDLAEKERLLAEKEKAHAAKASAPAAPTKGPSKTKKTVDGEHIHLSPVAGASGAFGKREAAAEEQYFRKAEHDKIEHLKHPEKK